MSRLVLLSFFAFFPVPSVAQATGSRADMIARMDQADSNQDGAITRAELIDWRKANFMRFDRNGDGVLSDSDIPRFVRGTSIGAQFDDLKTQFDINRDGRVTRDEFIGAPTVLFDAADANRDNIVTRAERDAAVANAKASKG